MAKAGEGRRVRPRHAAWEFFGKELKRRREAAELTQDELGRRVFVSGGYIGQFEQAIRKPQIDVADRIDEILQTDGFFGRMCRKLINDKRYAGYFAAVAELEQLATKICEFEPVVVPGLLQTAAYARAVSWADNPFADESRVEEKVTARLERAHVLANPARPLYWAIVHEHVLRIPVGGRAAMSEQLHHILDLVHEHRALVQVIPYCAGAHAAMAASLRVMEFEDAPPTAYTEGPFSGQLIDDPAAVRQIQAAYDLLRAAALSPQASLKMIETAAEEHRK